MLLLLFACTTPDPDPTPTACPGDDGGAVSLQVAPYVQWVGETDAWIFWETDAGTGSRVDWGPDLANTTCGERVPAIEGGDPDDALTQVHAVHLTGLTPGELVQYRARTGQTTSEVARFQTAAPGPFRVVAMSDAQRDDSNPTQFAKIVQDGVLPVVQELYGPNVEQELAMVLFPGDLVDNGWLIGDWQDDFFAAGAPLFQGVPLYPAIGNHEGGTPLYFRYFHLPGGLDEHAWSLDRDNVRVLALDSNGWQEDAQLDWLSTQLDDACTDPALDFVFAQLHHPWQSELWTPGNSDFTGAVVAKLETFSTECGKPSVHFFGHTHGYSRGQSLDHEHLMVNVASAGGAIDRWGGSQQDYPSFSVSQDTWGFVLVEVTGGDDAHFTVRRFSQGNADVPADNVETDQITIWRNNAPPQTPTVSCSDGLMAVDAFSDPDGHDHQATHWQAGIVCEELVLEVWRQDRNEFAGEDLQADDDLSDEPLPQGAGCVRARVRDQGLVWSAWSEPTVCD